MLYKIGEFSKLCQIPVKTLRYYDEIKLLNPAVTAPYTGYRMYETNQLQEVARIKALKEMGFTLEEIIMFQGNPMALIREKEEELLGKINLLKNQLKQLKTSKNYLLKENLMMFHVIIKEQKKLPVVSKRMIFDNKEEAEVLLHKMLKNEERVNNHGGIINFDNSYTVSNLDLEVFVVTETHKADKVLYDENQLVASIICDKCSLEEGYRCLFEYLKENHYQIVGNATEWYMGEQIELIIPIHKLHERLEHPQNDNIHLPFIDDPEVIGHWKVVISEPSIYTKEEFHPKKIKWNEVDGDIQDLFFLPEGEWYWCFGWTKGFVLSKFGLEQEGLNPYTIEVIDGKKYMFLEFRDGDSFYCGAKPVLIVLEQMDQKKWSKDEIRIKDQLTDSYEEDTEVIGKWQVKDLVRTVKDFNPDTYNAAWCPKEKLFFKNVEFKKDGQCNVLYGDKRLEWPIMNWSKGVLQNTQDSLSEKYERRVMNGTEYLFVEWKSGDYTFNRQQPWMYVFTRVIE